MKTPGTVSKKTRFLWLIAAPLFLSAAATILSSFYFLAFPGGFQGGSQLKRTLLEQEGVEFLPTGRVPLSRMCYQ